MRLSDVYTITIKFAHFSTEFTSELKKSSSISSLDSAFTDGVSPLTFKEHITQFAGQNAKDTWHKTLLET